MNRNLLISLGITSITSILLLYYFRTKMGKVEKKLDMMYQLIEEHTQSINQVNHTVNDGTNDEANDVINIPLYESNQQELMFEQMGGSVEQHDDGKIEISESESEYETDSEEETDTESVIKATDHKNLEFEIDELPDLNSKLSLEEVQEIQDEIKMSGGTNEVMADYTTFKNNNSVTVDHSLEVDSNLTSDTKQDLLEESDIDKNKNFSKTEGSECTEQEELDDIKVESPESPIHEFTNYNMLTVVQLKNLARNEGLMGYSSMKKKELIELLSKNI